MAYLRSTAVLHFIWSTRLLAEITPSVGFHYISKNGLCWCYTSALINCAEWHQIKVCWLKIPYWTVEALAGKRLCVKLWCVGWTVPCTWTSWGVRQGWWEDSSLAYVYVLLGTSSIGHTWICCLKNEGVTLSSSQSYNETARLYQWQNCTGLTVRFDRRSFVPEHRVSVLLKFFRHDVMDVFCSTSMLRSKKSSSLEVTVSQFKQRVSDVRIPCNGK